MATRKYVLFAAILVQASVVLSQDGQMFMADDQPSSAYTIYNGKVYVQPKKEDGFFSNLFKFDLYKNPVVQTVLGWTDLWYGTPANNDTEIVPTTDPLLAQSSYNRPQYAPAPQNFQQGYGNYPQGNRGVYGKQPYPYGGDASQQRPSMQNYPQKPPQFGNQLSQGYGQNPTSPQVPPYMNPSNFQYFGNPNVDIVNSLESHGIMDNLLGSEDRNFKAGLSKDEDASKSSTGPSAAKRQGAPQPDGSSADVMSKRAASKADDKAVEDHYQCPSLGQWKWNGEVCIAIGPYPTWACKPSDMIMTGRVAVCRNKIFFPNEP